MKLGFTGTRKGMSAPQWVALRAVLAAGAWGEFHHGDCVGADQDAHALARLLRGLRIVVHPPNRERGRAHCKGDEDCPPLPHLKRNAAIVRAADRLFAAPAGPERMRGSGTWQCIREAGRQGKPVLIVYPDGTEERRE